VTSSGLHLSSVGEGNQIASGELPNLAPLANPWLLWFFFLLHFTNAEYEMAGTPSVCVGAMLV